MAPKRKAKNDETRRSSVKKPKISQEKPRSKTPTKARAKTPIKLNASASKSPSNARSKPLTTKSNVGKASPKPKADTPRSTKSKNANVSSAGKSRKKSPAKTSPPQVATPPSFKIIRPRAWEEKAAQVMREQLELMSADDSVIKPPAERTTDSYLDAYWNLPALKHRDELPDCYFRACIFDGYRDHWTWHEATVSLFAMHNETMCIWSHLLPLLCNLVAAVWLSMEMQANDSTPIEQLMMGIFVLTACSCLFLSSVYHWFGCMSEGHFYCLLSMDLGGIACLIAGSFFPGVYYGFYCTPVLQQIYIGVTCLILVIGIVVSVYGATKSPNAALIRQGGFASLTIFGFVPLCHWLLIAPKEYKDEMTVGALAMFFFYGLGFSCLLTSFPESVWKNNYITTYLVPSHSLWHLGVAAAIFTWFFALLGQQALLKEKTCEPFLEYIAEQDMGSYAF